LHTFGKYIDIVWSSRVKRKDEKRRTRKRGRTGGKGKRKKNRENEGKRKGMVTSTVIYEIRRL